MPSQSTKIQRLEHRDALLSQRIVGHFAHILDVRVREGLA
jgi:hypothetical protein